MHSTDHPSTSRLGVNAWLILGEDERILDVRAKLYCVRGGVQKTAEFLESRVELDYYVAQETGPPELRFSLISGDLDDYPTAPPIFMNDQRIAENWCLLFGGAITRQFENLPAINFLEWEAIAKTVYRGTAFMLNTDGTLSRHDVDLSKFLEPLFA